MRLFRNSWIVASKDLRSEFRTKETLNAALSFALVILVLFSFAFDPGSDMIRTLSGGLLWLVFLFAGALILNRSFARELPNDCLDTLMSSPLNGAELFLGKCIASFALLLIVDLISLAIFGLFYNARWTRQFPLLASVVVLGTWAITVIGTMFSALTVNLRLRELMLPTLVYPFLIPALMGAILLTNNLIGSDTLDKDNYIWFKVLVGFDIVFTLLGLALSETALVG